MLDPGALGTLLIGLDRARHEFDPIPDGRRHQRPVSPAAVPRVRRAAAAVLHMLARRIEPRVPASDGSAA